MRVLAVLFVLFGLGLGTKDDDLITNLPGLTFNPNFKQYSGYLDATPGNKLHYWLVEAQSSPQWAPILLWLNGGPGCSSLDGFLTEMGPFRPSKDGQTLQENVFSWNKFANMFYMEAPRDVGFSYRDPNYPNDTLYNDDKTATDNAYAVKSFFEKFPEYKDRPFYVTGESYGGVYVPTLTNLLVKMIQNGSLPNVNLMGMAVGNGALSRPALINSGIDLVYYRGIIGKPEFEEMQQCCSSPNDLENPLQYCNFAQYVHIDDYGNAVPNAYNSPLMQWCANKTVQYGQDLVWNTLNSVYNTWQDCYSSPQSAGDSIMQHINRDRYLRMFSTSGDYQMFADDGQNPFVDEGAKVNADSTDSVGSFPCFATDAAQAYLNRDDVRKALHIPQFVQPWQLCNDNMNSVLYIQQNPDMTPVFQSMLDSGYPLRFLIYNGDADMACQFLGDQWFIEDLANKNKMTVTSPRQVWNYTRSNSFIPRVGGFTKSFTTKTVSIDLLTVKGAGHMVPTDRPGPGFQMMSNFVMKKANYSDIAPIDYTPRQLLGQYQVPAQPVYTRKQADRVWSLPGLTYRLNFQQFSGYLKGVDGNYLHYWLVESQSNPSTDPLVLWLNGGPGCSSLGGFLTELGPFHPNPDGKTLYENIYSWNKAANILFLEGPRNVGYSIQNQSINNDQIYNDVKTAQDNYLALKDFLTVFPEYVNRPFYVTGESYGGVYVPTLTSLLIDKIQSGDLPGLNLVGMAVGNGELSALQQINSAIHLLYFHGIYGKKEWDQLQPCCPNNGDPTWFEFCDFSQHIKLDSSGNAMPRDNTSTCGNLVAQLGQWRVWDTLNDVYNIYQDCYQQTSVVFGSRNLHRHKKMIRGHLEEMFMDQGADISGAVSTDNQGGFPCYASSAAADWLNQGDVRSALHISPMAGTWTDCNDTINEIYVQQHNDTGSVFDHILATNYPLRMLIYNGDVDTACNFLGDQWFVEKLAERSGMTVAQKRKEWRYMNQIAGYTKQFAFGKGTIDVLTVKGAGHLVPTDRPGPALQMFANFIRQQDYSNSVAFSDKLTPLNEAYQILEKVAAASGSSSQNSSEEDDLSFEEKLKIAHQNKRRSGRQMSVKKDEENVNRAKRATNSAPPPPPAGSKATDLITSLPGLTFTPNYKQYSGYLKASTGNYLHYWLVESQSKPSTDPLVLWLNGGPGCSSLGGFFTELGPLGVNPDGETLFENVYAWNKYANVLFLEAPRGVGFSYRSNEVDPDNMYNDTYTAMDNVLALGTFFDRFTEFQGRDFYITGESYGGIYIPTLTDALIKKIKDNTYKIKLAGVAIGNGEMSEVRQINSAIPLLYFKGVHDKADFDALKPCCQNLSVPMTYCNFMQYVTLDHGGNAIPKYNDGSQAAKCGQMVMQQGYLDVWATDNDVYNTYQDCYTVPGSSGGSDSEASAYKTRSKRAAVQPLTNAQQFVDQAKKINYKSTDANSGFYCYNGDATQAYLGRADVRKALHIPDGVIPWVGCNDNMNANYIQMHNDTKPVFQSILQSNYSVRFLIYNGDADMACQFLGDQWFIEDLADTMKMTASGRTSWNYTIPGNNTYLPRIGGYLKSFAYTGIGNTVTMDLMTVKGGGHFVPADRPGPALQMLYNFVNQRDYSKNVPDRLVKTPLLPQFTTAAPKIPQMKADKIMGLPGLTFQPQFNQHSGYLKANTGVYLHYWFVESQNDPSNDPVILWLNGGPGCSSLAGLFTEHGPFRPNPDGTTLFENVYTWNRGANILYLESPRIVGFSYQDHSVNNDTIWDDDKTASDNAAAIAQFFNTYEHFRKNDFYVSGESYGGIYVPTLTALLIKQIQSKQIVLNLKGMVVGNGLLSAVQDVNSLPDFMYFHGMYDKSEWDALRMCCAKFYPSDHQGCDYSNFVFIGDDGSPHAKTFNNTEQQKCANNVEQLAGARVWNIVDEDVYNFYQDCYLQTTPVFGSLEMTREDTVETYKMGAKVHVQAAITDMLSYNDPVSTDSQGGFQCYMTAALLNYFNQSHVRDAIHVPDYVQQWEFCTSNPAFNYTVQHNDTGPIFQQMIDSGYPMKILIYNGDVDTACSMFEAEYFIEALAKKNNMTTDYMRQQWMFRSQIAGYTKRFAKGNVTVDLLTVKGAGHFVPTDRPGPALQMIYNYLGNYKNYSMPVTFDLTRQPLYAQYTQNGNGPVPPVSNTTTTTTTITPMGTGSTVTVTGTGPTDPMDGSSTTSGNTGSTVNGTTTGTTTAVPPGKGNSSVLSLFTTFVALIAFLLGKY